MRRLLLPTEVWVPNRPEADVDAGTISAAVYDEGHEWEGWPIATEAYARWEVHKGPRDARHVLVTGPGEDGPRERLALGGFKAAQRVDKHAVLVRGGDDTGSTSCGAARRQKLQMNTIYSRL